MPDFVHHQSLRLENFTAFRDAEFELVPGVNAIIGENGAGKTHLLKCLYAFQLASARNDHHEQVLRGVFQVEDIRPLIRNSALFPIVAKISGTSGDESWAVALQSGQFGPRNWGSIGQPIAHKMTRPVFIPAIDMMGHTRRFLSTYDEHQIDFDQTHRDIVSLLLSPESRQKPPGNGWLGDLSKTLGGEVEEEGERFYLRTTHSRQPIPLVAEGLRKIATLSELIKNGWLEPGSVIFWDEPETNLNPILMQVVVAALLNLTRSGVQVFVATHSYEILKELDLQSQKSDSVRYFALARGEDGTDVHATDDYSQIKPNAIADEFDRLYDLEIKRAMGGVGNR